MRVVSSFVFDSWTTRQSGHQALRDTGVFGERLVPQVTANPDRRVREGAVASRLSTVPSERHFGGRPGQLDFQVAHFSQSCAVRRERSVPTYLI